MIINFSYSRKDLYQFLNLTTVPGKQETVLDLTGIITPSKDFQLLDPRKLSQNTNLDKESFEEYISWVSFVSRMKIRSNRDARTYKTVLTPLFW
ncbi:MAG: hypothetical protein ACHQRM_18205, partial [Bacteroidia bacterium]